MMASITKNKNPSVLREAIVLAICLAIWQILALLVGNSYFLPSVPQTLSALVGLVGRPSFFGAVLVSLLRVALGLILGVVSGALLATLSHLLPVLHAFISPVISIMKATPVAAIILILWFTFTDATLAIFVVFLMVTPIIWQNVYDGYRSISKEMREVCEIFEFY